MTDQIKLFKDKIARKDTNFDEFDYDFLDRNPELIPDLIVLLASGKEYWNNSVGNILCESMIPLIPEELSEDFWSNYIKYEVDDSNYFGSSALDSVIDVIKLKPDTLAALREYEEAHKRFDTFSNLTYFTNDCIRELIKYNRWDLVSSAKIEGYREVFEDIEPNLVDTIFELFPYDQYPTPSYFGFFPERVIDKMDILSAETLAIMYSNYKENSLLSKKYTKEELFDILVERLLSQPHEHTIVLNSELKNPFLKGFFDDSEADAKIINHVTKLFRNNIITSLNNLIKSKIVSEEELVTKLLDYIGHTDSLENIKQDITYDEVTAFLQRNPILVDRMIEKGFLAFLINTNLISDFTDKESYCIYALENFDKTTERLNPLKLTIGLTKNKELFSAIIDLPEITEVECSNHLHLESDTEFSYIAFLIEIARKRPDIKLVGLEQVQLYKNERELIELLVKNNKSNELINIFENRTWISNKFLNFFEKNNDLVINIFNSFPKTYVRVLNTIDKSILDNYELCKKIFNNRVIREETIKYVNHHENLASFYTEKNFNLLVDGIVEDYNIIKENLLALETKFGPTIIKYLDNENIQKLLKLPKEILDKLINLFPDTTYTMKDLESSYDSLKQYEFSRSNQEVISVFSNILHAIEDGNDKCLTDIIPEIIKYLDKQFFNKLDKIYKLPEGFDASNPENFIKLLFNKIKKSPADKKEKYISILHQVTDYYITKKREEYRTTYDMIGELDLPYNIDEKHFAKEIIKYYIEESASYTFNIDKLKTTCPNEGFLNSLFDSSYKYVGLQDLLQAKLQSYGIDASMAYLIVKYFCEETKYYIEINSEQEEKIKKNYRYIYQAMTEIKKLLNNDFYFTKANENQILATLNRRGRLKKIYEPGSAGIDMYEILTNIDIDILSKTVFANDELYSSLQEQLRKRKPHLLPYTLKVLLEKEKVNISSDFQNIAAFITNYSSIYAKERDLLASKGESDGVVSFNITNILINAEVNASVSSIYSQVLGGEDFKLIKSNPGPNQAVNKTADNGRLKEAVSLTEQLFKRKTVNIPTFNEVIAIPNNKKMRVVVGNFTHPCNLTHGERTGACMRIGGLGESLFNFVLDNENGFHIRFENPETGKYVSRVSGFRNGNTVYLNELRCSCDSASYEDEDIVEACRKTAKMLIELSKDSTYPIDNVVIHRAYATIGMREQEVTLDVDSIKKGLPHFYSDVSNRAIVLATNAQEGEFTSVKTSKRNIPSYQPSRSTPVLTDNIALASSKIVRVDTVKRMLAGEKYEYITPLEFPSGLIYAIVSDDWYIYVDTKGNIHKDLMDIDPRAKEELAEYLIKLETEINLEDIKLEANYGKK